MWDDVDIAAEIDISDRRRGPWPMTAQENAGTAAALERSSAVFTIF